MVAISPFFYRWFARIQSEKWILPLSCTCYKSFLQECAQRESERRKRKSSAYIIVGIILLTSIMHSVHFSQNTGQHLFIIGNVFKSGKEDIETGHFNRDTQRDFSFFPPVWSEGTQHALEIMRKQKARNSIFCRGSSTFNCAFIYNVIKKDPSDCVGSRDSALITQQTAAWLLKQISQPCIVQLEWLSRSHCECTAIGLQVSPALLQLHYGNVLATPPLSLTHVQQPQWKS